MPDWFNQNATVKRREKARCSRSKWSTPGNCGTARGAEWAPSSKVNIPVPHMTCF